ncbi:glycerol kinase GlpK [Inquilinus sp. CAU 1745]|uniref:glycerol kinase GlpK n=1 Tax=Inquilinus sp. CAU 1745 TaxID=3140369 RepID=UPI00325A7125
MAGKSHVLAIDQGTTSTRAIIFDHAGLPVATGQKELPQHYPADGWVEHDPEDIWADTLAVCRQALDRAELDAAAIAAIGITNQRETTILWDRATGKPVYNAIVWQDQRTAARCRELVEAGHQPMVQEKTGLLISPYFCATKLAWILDSDRALRRRAEKGELAFGTVDTFLLYRLTGGRVHATDATNASCTLLFDITAQDWDDELLRLFDIPRALLPEVMDSSAAFGVAGREHLGAEIPITGMAGDQQAAMFGQACLEPGMVKSTYGTGCFALMNIGDKPILSKHRMLTTVAIRLAGKPTYAIEGSIFVAGAAVKWLRDRLGIIDSAARTASMAVEVPDSHGVYMVPAFTGLGAPHWDSDARAAILGLTFDAGPAHIARAALESVAYQTRDLMDAMIADSGGRPAALRVDGGMVVNDWVCQFLADMLDIPVERPRVTETTALGAAFLAGLHEGVYPDLGAVSAAWKRDRLFEPRMDPALRERLFEGWQKAVRLTRGQ